MWKLKSMVIRFIVRSVIIGLIWWTEIILVNKVAPVAIKLLSERVSTMIWMFVLKKYEKLWKDYHQIFLKIS